MNPILSRQQLLATECRPLEGSPCTTQAVQAQLAALPGWHHRDNTIERRFTLRDYPATLAFVNAVAAMAQAQDHHPELVVTSRHCVVRWNTHSVNGVSVNDFICAAHCDALYAQAG